ncbi:MAG: tRNA-dihydrouridine synthase family protein [Pontiellaceae bacterium]|nr:tRNA-dihydrouridine synthase family protein [Pontiellaceae bacterium]MBN2785723.1 tRNA-dihydrouridine synthase family protein [Pontiellaceae bacterium]
MQIRPLQFGSVTIENPVVLAPMAGYTDAAMRTLCLEHGAGAVYTELASSEGLSRDGGRTFCEVLESPWPEHPVAGHIFGADPDRMAEAAKLLEQDGRFDWIDLNCGCPVKKVVSRGAGAALLKDLPLMSRIIEKVKRSVSLPVSVKTRIGFNHDTADHLEIARMVEESGADMIAVHARLAKNFHGGDPDLEKLAGMKQTLNIPVIGNGGAFTPEDAFRMVDVSGVDGVMIGRGAVGNPWIFEQIRQGSRVACDTEPVPQATRLLERRDLMAEHLKRLVALNERKQEMIPDRAKRYTPEEAACIQFRTHIPYYVKGLFDKKQLLMKLASLMSVAAIMEEIDILMEKNK